MTFTDLGLTVPSGSWIVPPYSDAIAMVTQSGSVEALPSQIQGSGAAATFTVTYEAPGEMSSTAGTAVAEHTQSIFVRLVSRIAPQRQVGGRSTYGPRQTLAPNRSSLDEHRLSSGHVRACWCTRPGLDWDSEAEYEPAVHVRCVCGEDHGGLMCSTADLTGNLRVTSAERTASVLVQEVGLARKPDDTRDHGRRHGPGRRQGASVGS